MYLFLLLLSVAVFAAVAIWYVRQDFASVFHPISYYLLFHGFVFVIRPLFAYWGEYYHIYRAFQFIPSPQTKMMVIVCANLGMLAFVFGAWLTGATKLVFRQGQPELRDRDLLIKPFLVVFAILLPIGAYSLWYSLNATEGTMRLVAGTGTSINTTENGWFMEAQLLLVPLGALLAWVFRFKLWSLLPLAVFVLLRASTGGRGPFVIASVAVALLWLYDRKRRFLSTGLTAMLLVLVGGFYLVGQDRGAAVRGLLDDGTVVSVERKHGFMESMDFANLEFFEYLVETIPERTGTHAYFVHNLQLFTEPVPRVLWEDKPVGAPIKMYNLWDHGSPIGMTSSLPGEGWSQAGIVGVVFWCGVWGLALGAFYSYFARGTQSNIQVAVYLCFLPIFVIAFRDGVLITVVKNAVFYLVPVFLWMLCARLMGVSEGGKGLPPQGSRPQRRGTANGSPPPEPMRGHLLGRRPHLRVAEAPIVPRAWRRRGAAHPAE